MGLLHWHFWFVQRKPLASSNSRHFIDIRDIKVWITYLVMFFAKIYRLSILPHCIGYLFVSYFYRILQCTCVSAYISGSMDVFFLWKYFDLKQWKKKQRICAFFSARSAVCIDKTNIRYLCSSSDVVHLKMSPVKPGTWDFVYFCAHFSISMRIFVDMFGIRIRGKRGCIEANA